MNDDRKIEIREIDDTYYITEIIGDSVKSIILSNIEANAVGLILSRWESRNQYTKLARTINVAVGEIF
jgi:hypothetical protein